MSPEALLDLIDAIRRGERVEAYATRWMAKDGRELKAWITLLPLTDHGGRLVGIRKIATPEEPQP